MIAVIIVLLMTNSALLILYLREVIRSRRQAERIRETQSRLALKNIELLERIEQMTRENDALTASNLDLLERIQPHATS